MIKMTRMRRTRLISPDKVEEAVWLKEDENIEFRSFRIERFMPCQMSTK